MADSPTETRTRRAWSRIGRLLAATLALGVTVRLTVRDGNPCCAPLYYAFPLPVLAGLAWVWAGLVLLLNKRRELIVAISAAVALTVWCLAVNLQWHPVKEDSSAFRILCWNVGHGKHGDWKSLVETIHDERPHIAGLIEAAGFPEDILPYLAESCPDYQVVMLGKGIVCLTRGTPGFDTLTPLADGGYVGQMPVNLEGREVVLLLVDIKSNPFRDRAAPLAALADLASHHSNQPVLILGDFNTPSDSVYLGPLRAAHEEAFEVAGRGYQPTWPVPVPVLHLDQIWTNRHLRPISCAHGWTSASDHRPVIADVAFAGED